MSYLSMVLVFLHLSHYALSEREVGDLGEEIEPTIQSSTVDATASILKQSTPLNTTSSSNTNWSSLGINRSTFYRGLIVFSAFSVILIIYFGIRTYR